MPRPRKCCYIAQPPAVAGMRPVGGDSVAPEAVTLRYDEYEAIRLIDHQGLTQAAAAERMGISRPTCTRLYDRARRTLAAALVEGRPLRIEGGKVCHSERWYRCPHCRRIHTGTPRCPACRRNEDSEILGQPNTTYNPINTVIMEKIALPTRNGAVDDHFGHCECYTIFTLDADRRIAGRQTLPAAEGCGCKSDIAPRLHAMGVDVMLAGNMGDGAKTSSNATVSPSSAAATGLSRRSSRPIWPAGSPIRATPAHTITKAAVPNTAGRQAGISPNDGTRCRRHDPQSFCGDLFERSPLFFRKKPLSGKFFVFLPRREFQRRGEASLRPDEKGIGCNSRTVPAAVNSGIRPERRMYSATRSGH